MIVVILFIVFLAPNAEPTQEEIYIPSLQHPEQFGQNNMLDFWSGRQ